MKLAPLILLATFAFVARGEDWPQFRGPTGQGLSTATNVPVAWGAEQNVAWKVSIPGKGWSSPVLSKRRLYLTTAVGQSGGPTSLRAICLDATTGKTIWDVEALRADPADAKKIHAKNSPASPTPVVTADRLYVHFGHMGTAALDLDGKVVWRQTSLKYAPIHGNGASPVLVDDELIFSCDGAANPMLVALDARTGDVRWKTPRNTIARAKFSFATVLPIELGGRTQIVSPTSGFVGGYDPATGKELWRVRYGEGYSVVPRPVFAGGLLFVSSGFDAPVLYAINPTNAAGDVTDKNVAWTARKGAPCTPSPIIVGDAVYTVSDAGIATCFDPKTGKPHWTHRLSGGSGGFSASPVAAEDRIYFQNEAGVGYVVKADPAKYEQLAENDLGEPSLASYAVADGALFIRTDGHLWRIGAK